LFAPPSFARNSRASLILAAFPLGIALAALAFAVPGPLAVAGAAQIGYRHGLVEFGDSAEDLSNELGCRAGICELVWAIRSNRRDAGSLQPLIARFLHHQVAGEATGRLDDDGLHAVAGNLFER
jgi:hypothetical protein